ncbi:hypothetical protein ACLOJK_030033 [Asimina triloba]
MTGDSPGAMPYSYTPCAMASSPSPAAAPGQKKRVERKPSDMHGSGPPMPCPTLSSTLSTATNILFSQSAPVHARGGSFLANASLRILALVVHT